MKLQPAVVTMTGNKDRTQITVRKVRQVRTESFKPYTDPNASTIKVVKRKRTRNDLPPPAPQAKAEAKPEEPEPDQWPHPPLTDEQRKPTSRKHVIDRQYAHLDARGVDGTKATAADTGTQDAVGR